MRDIVILYLIIDIKIHAKMTDIEKTPVDKPKKRTRQSSKMDITARYGFPKDIKNGTLFTTRRELTIAGVHRLARKTLDIGPYGVISAIVSNDEFILDCWKRIIYEAPLVEISTQKKLAQKKSCKNIDGFKLSYLNQRPVRLIRSHEHKGGLGPKAGYRYDGLFLVTYFWETVVDEKYICHRYELNYDLTTQKYIAPPELHLRSNVDSNVINIAENKGFYSCLRVQGGNFVNNGRLINSEIKDDDLSISFLHVNRDQKRVLNPPIVKTETIKEEIDENTSDIENETYEDIEIETYEDIEIKTSEDIEIKSYEDIEIKANEDIEINTCEESEIIDKTDEDPRSTKTDEDSNTILGYRIYNWPENFKSEFEPEEVKIQEIEINTDNPVDTIKTNPDPLENSDSEDSDKSIEIPIIQRRPKLKIRRIRLRRINRKYKNIIDHFLVVRNQNKCIESEKCKNWKACVYDMNFSRFINLISKEKICPCTWRTKLRLASIELKALSQYIINNKDSDSVMVKICKKSPHMCELIKGIPINEMEYNSNESVVNKLILQLKGMIVKFPILCLHNCPKIVKQKKIIRPNFNGFSMDNICNSKLLYETFKTQKDIIKKTNQEKPGCSHTHVITID